MPDIRPMITAADRYSIVVAFSIRDPAGIQKVRIIDIDGIEISSADFPCPDGVFYEPPPINRSRCPVRVETTICLDNVTFVSPPYYSPLPDADHPLPCSAVMCEDDTDCIEAQSLLTRQRNLLDSMCERLRSIQNAVDHAYRMMTLFYALAAAMAALAIALSFIPFYGWIVGGTAALMAALLLVFALLWNERVNRYRRWLDEQHKEMEEARIRFTDIVDEVTANCCRDCITTDLTMPVCRL